VPKHEPATIIPPDVVLGTDTDTDDALANAVTAVPNDPALVNEIDPPQTADVEVG
jgi:hypothetical protein